MLFRRKYNDEKLIHDIRIGGKSAELAIQYIYTTYRKSVIQFVLTLNGNKAEGLDVFQEGVLQLVISIEKGKFEGKSSLKTYFFGICKRLWYRKFNRNVRADQYRKSLDFTDIEFSNPESLLIDKSKMEIVEKILDGLKPKSKEVLLLWIQNYSMKEIAVIMGFKNEQVARNKKSLSLKQLRKHIEKNKNAQILATALTDWEEDIMSENTKEF